MSNRRSTNIPPPLDDDLEDVHVALSAASTLWRRGEASEALKWLRRAAGSAAESDADVRAVELFKAAADVASALDEQKRRSRTPAPAASLAAPPVKASEAAPTGSPRQQRLAHELDFDDGEETVIRPETRVRRALMAIDPDYARRTSYPSDSDREEQDDADEDAADEVPADRHSDERERAPAAVQSATTSPRATSAASPPPRPAAAYRRAPADTAPGGSPAATSAPSKTAATATTSSLAETALVNAASAASTSAGSTSADSAFADSTSADSTSAGSTSADSAFADSSSADSAFADSSSADRAPARRHARSERPLPRPATHALRSRATIVKPDSARSQGRRASATAATHGSRRRLTPARRLRGDSTTPPGGIRPLPRSAGPAPPVDAASGTPAGSDPADWPPRPTEPEDPLAVTQKRPAADQHALRTAPGLAAAALPALRVAVRCDPNGELQLTFIGADDAVEAGSAVALLVAPTEQDARILTEIYQTSRNKP